MRVWKCRERPIHSAGSKLRNVTARIHFPGLRLATYPRNLRHEFSTTPQPRFFCGRGFGSAPRGFKTALTLAAKL